MNTLSKSIFTFLNHLEKNNNRDWFAANKPVYQNELEKIKSFFNEVKNKLELHDEIEKLKLFRIYRDVRFSKDKTPYKIHFDGHFTRASKRLRGGYYLRIKPGESMLAGGFWAPNKEDLFRIRKEFEIGTIEIRNILNDSNFIANFDKIQGESLKTAPRGFDKSHPDLDLIKMKQFIVVRHFTNQEVLATNFLDEINKSYKAMRPFFDYMSEILTTDLNGVSLID